MILTEKQKKNCPYCHNSVDLIVTNQEDPLDGDLIYIWCDWLRYETNIHNIARRIHYCLMCGRPLSEEEE